jgi:outer membrane protein assembly factor BamB
MKRIRIFAITLVAFVTLVATTEGQTNAAHVMAVTNSVQADWTEFHKQNMWRWNGAENTLGVNNVGSLQVKWSNNLNSSEIFPSPAISKGVVYIGSENGDSLSALDAGKGTVIWDFITGGIVLSSPAVANSVVYFGSDDNSVYAVNATTGAKLWSYRTGSQVESAPTVLNGVVFVGSLDDNEYALNANTGALMWRYKDWGLDQILPCGCEWSGLYGVP